MNIYASIRKGKEKSHSEDRIVINDIVLNNESRMFENVTPKIVGIADGVGGNAGGELASQFVCEKALSLDDANTLKKSAELNAELLKYAKSIQGMEKMATTFSAVIFDDPDKIIHIGNTRIYAVQDGCLIQLTNDHTTYNALLYRGFYEQAELCNKSEILTCFGGGTPRFFEPDIAALCEFQQFVFTSDGIHDFVDTDKIEEIINSGEDTESISKILFDTALAEGSYDDMSLILINI